MRATHLVELPCHERHELRETDFAFAKHIRLHDNAQFTQRTPRAQHADSAQALRSLFLFTSLNIDSISSVASRTPESKRQSTRYALTAPTHDRDAAHAARMRDVAATKPPLDRFDTRALVALGAAQRHDCYTQRHTHSKRGGGESSYRTGCRLASSRPWSDLQSW